VQNLSGEAAESIVIFRDEGKLSGSLRWFVQCGCTNFHDLSKLQERTKGLSDVDSDRYYFLLKTVINLSPSS
jgi:hypothetical protein